MPTANDKHVDYLEGLAERVALEGYGALAADERDLFNVYVYEFETSLGGLAGFFTSRADPCDTAAALERFGAPQSAAILRRACSLFRGGRPPDEIGQRQVEATALVDSFDELNRELLRTGENALAVLTDRVRAIAR